MFDLLALGLTFPSQTLQLALHGSDKRTAALRLVTSTDLFNGRSAPGFKPIEKFQAELAAKIGRDKN